MRGSGIKFRLLIGLVIVGFAFVKKCNNKTVNPYTNRVQNINMDPQQEIAIGIQSAPQMAQQHGGLHPDQKLQTIIDNIGNKLINSSMARETPYQYDFHLLADERTVNAFALPGGQCFITAALFERLQNEDQLAGVLGHEIGHVIHRHGAERMAKSGFIQGLIQSVMIGSGGDAGMTQIAGMIGNYTNMKYGRDQELESDEWGLQSPENRREKIKEFIENYRRKNN